MTDDLREKINNLPGTAGAYIFKGSDESIIYVGKAKNIKKRVQSHFSRPGQHTVDFTPLVCGIDFINANNENEALLLESQLIKKYQPRYNVIWKDDKDYFFIGFTKENFPRAAITHRLENYERDLLVGPFMQGGQLRDFMRQIRKILPYRTCANLQKSSCMFDSLGLCPAPCVNPRQTNRIGNILNTMRTLLKAYQGASLKIECYDISNLAGTLTVGSMVVFERGKPDKSQYRKFKIKNVAGQNDVACLREVLMRRLGHDEWRKPDLIILDGGKGQLKAARGIDIPLLALAKIGKNDGKLFSPYSKSYIQLSRLPKNIADIFLQIRDEAHRFAITYNKQQRESLLKK